VEGASAGGAAGAADATVTLKGRVACEMNTCDELIAAGMLFTNVLEPLNPPEAAAVLSALVFQVHILDCVYMKCFIFSPTQCMRQEKADDGPQLTPRMEAARRQMKEIFDALTVLQVSPF